MRHRSAATLVEVLVAIFVTGIGLLALLALFPLGALTMAQAIKDDRTASAAKNAEVVAGVHAVRQSAWSVDGAPDPFISPGVVAPAHPELPSYSVYIDPVGFQAFTAVQQGSSWVGAFPGGLARRSLRFIHIDPLTNVANSAGVKSQLTTSWFTLLDDAAFLKDVSKTGAYQGLPCPPVNAAEVGAGVVKRDGRYSWAFLAKRPRSYESKAVDLTIVVYSGRQTSVQLAANTVVPLGETVYTTPARPVGGPAPYSNLKGMKNVSITWAAGQEKPALRKGNWILDASLEVTADLSAQQPRGWSHGYFYRVVGMTDTGTNSMDLELQTPLREDVDGIVQANGETVPLSTGTAPRTRAGRIIVLDNVAEVFEKGTGWTP
jgi:hypothetical protein